MCRRRGPKKQKQKQTGVFFPFLLAPWKGAPFESGGRGEKTDWGLESCRRPRARDLDGGRWARLADADGSCSASRFDLLCPHTYMDKGRDPIDRSVWVWSWLIRSDQDRREPGSVQRAGPGACRLWIPYGLRYSAPDTRCPPNQSSHQHTRQHAYPAIPRLERAHAPWRRQGADPNTCAGE